MRYTDRPKRNVIRSNGMLLMSLPSPVQIHVLSGLPLIRVLTDFAVTRTSALDFERSFLRL